MTVLQCCKLIPLIEPPKKDHQKSWNGKNIIQITSWMNLSVVSAGARQWNLGFLDEAPTFCGFQWVKQLSGSYFRRRETDRPLGPAPSKHGSKLVPKRMQWLMIFGCGGYLLQWRCDTRISSNQKVPKDPGADGENMCWAMKWMFPGTICCPTKKKQHEKQGHTQRNVSRKHRT